MQPPTAASTPAAVRLPKPKLLTYDDYARLTPPDSGSYELHNGQLIAMLTPTPKHQLCSVNLVTEINLFIRPLRLGRVIAAPMDTVFTPQDVLQPDILWLSADNLHKIGDKKIEGAPDLVVEILSPSNTPKEMAYKKMIYELSGVREYWLIHLDNQTLTQYENVEGEFVKRGVVHQHETLTAVVLQGFQLPLAAIFA